AAVPGTLEPADASTAAGRAAVLAAADAVGWPVLVKAAAGGGGRGMRRVDHPDDLEMSLEAASREAAAAFGDGSVYLERLVDGARHVEVQLLGDQHGGLVHLFERDCSLQRRHQKVIEEAPAPGMDEETREAVCSAAVRAAQAVNYETAGTIEFIADASEGLRADRIWFMEMNTRLQVEHPVTEMVTGYDLVREQIRVAAGHALSFKQSEVRWIGHAIECRVYAEDPENNFLPSPGRISFLRVPDGPGIRNDGGVEAGAEVSIYYDPMISKLAAWGRTREEAVDRLRRALDEYSVGGIRTTLPFFREIVRDREFIEGRLDTGFIQRFNERRAGQADELSEGLRDMAIIAAALDYQTKQKTLTADNHQREQSRWRMAGRLALERK
ncbi:MAG: methylcrotonoyl-CoA carboxylase, partial [Acidobacteriota bacterium]|nr:methylcrotonoyl-CoA carboxylase [Acidobacteriota bacterium]